MSEVRQLVATWISMIRLNNYETYYDINKAGEHLSRQLLNLLYDYQLKDLNETVKNYPGLDIGDTDKALVAYQVTSRLDSPKIIENLKTIVENKTEKIFTNGIRFLILNDAGKIQFTKRLKTQPESILTTFQRDADIIYPQNLIGDIEKAYENEIIKFYRIKNLLAKQLAPRATIQEETVQTNLEALAQALDRIAALAHERHEEAIDFSRDFFYGNLKVPAINIISRRESLINKLWEQINDVQLMWLQGAPAAGKTSVAILMAEKTKNVLWVECRDLSPDQTLEQMLALLLHHFKITAAPYFQETLEQLAETIPVGTLLIINDLPDLSKSIAIQRQVIELINRLSAGNISILVTSNYQAPENDLRQLVVATFTIRILPGLEQSDAEAILIHYGATAETANLLKELLISTTEGPPLLIHSAARYLQQRNWQLDNDSIETIFAGKYDDLQESEIYTRILQHTADEETRQLLYRLRCVLGIFSMDIITELAAIEPTIILPGEKVSRVKGIWLQEVESQQYQLSPLLKPLTGNLSRESQNQVFKTLAKEISRKEKISQIEAFRMIHYYKAASENNDAVIALTTVATELLSQPTIFFDWNFDLFWFYEQLPGDVGGFFKVHLRFLQINLSRAVDRDITFLLEDLNHIASSEDVGELGRALADLLFFSTGLLKQPVKAVKQLAAAIEASQKLEQFPTGSPIELTDELLNGIWVAFSLLKSKDEYQQWFGIVKSITLPFKTTDPQTNDVMVMASVSIYRNAVVQNDPREVPDLLKWMIELSVESGFPLVAVYALKYLIAFSIKENNDFVLAEALKQQYHSLIESEKLFRFLLYEEFGRRYYYTGNIERADEYLSGIEKITIPEIYTEQLDFLITYTQLSYKLRPKDSPVFAHKALQTALQGKHFLLEDKVKLYGEAAIASTNSGDLVEALNHYASGYSLLLDHYSESEEFQAAVIRYGNAIKYVTELLEKPKSSAFGNGRNVIPEPSFFYRTNENLLKDGFYFDERKFMVAHGLQNGFETIGHFESAKTWAYKSIELSLPLENPQYIVVLQTTLFYLFEKGHYAQAYNVLNHIERFFSRVKEKINKGENVDPVLVKNISGIGTNDTSLYFFLLLPIAFFFSHQIIDGKLLPEEYQKEIDKAFANENYQIKDLPSYGFAKQIFEDIVINRISLKQFQEKMRGYTGDYDIIFHHIGYILLSTFSGPVEAANLQLEMITGLDPFLGA